MTLLRALALAMLMSFLASESQAGTTVIQQVVPGVVVITNENGRTIVYTLKPVVVGVPGTTIVITPEPTKKED